MKASVRKWGNSLGIRVPMPIVKELQLSEGVELKISTMDGKLIIEPQPTIHYDLDSLLDEVNEDNLHGETLSGNFVGKEVW